MQALEIKLKKYFRELYTLYNLNKLKNKFGQLN